MRDRRAALAVLVALMGIAGCGGGSGGSRDGGGDSAGGADAAGDASLAATCTSYCQGCPDLFEDTDCANYCGGNDELARAASCESQWQAGWECVMAAARCVEQTICHFDDGGAGGCSSSLFGECEPPGDSFANCVEAYCRVNEQTCNDIATRYGL